MAKLPASAALPLALPCRHQTASTSPDAVLGATESLLVLLAMVPLTTMRHSGGGGWGGLSCMPFIGDLAPDTGF